MSLPLERNGHTATCNRLARKIQANELKLKKKPARIAKVSDKMAEALKVYKYASKEFVLGKRCAVFPEKWATEVHHKKGRATKELLLDEEFWLPVSREGHVKIELNPEWAKEQGFSLSRLATDNGLKLNYGIIDEATNP